MSSRFLTNMLSVVLGGFVVVVSQTFTPHTLSWVAFAVAIGIVAALAVAQLDRQRDLVQRGLDVGTMALGVLLIVLTRVQDGSSVLWVSFALALGLAGAGLVGLIVGEVANWRAQRGLGELHWLHAEHAERRLPTAVERSQAA